MSKQKIIKAFEAVIIENEIDKKINHSTSALATILYNYLESLAWLEQQPREALFGTTLPDDSSNKTTKVVDNTIKAFVDEMYGLYPTKCPKRNASLGKSHKDKDRIRRLLKIYTQEQIEQVIRSEVENNYGVNYMKNFSTFLNNFPEPIATSAKREQCSTNTGDKLIIDGVEYK